MNTKQKAKTIAPASRVCSTRQHETARSNREVEATEKILKSCLCIQSRHGKLDVIMCKCTTVQCANCESLYATFTCSSCVKFINLLINNEIWFTRRLVESKLPKWCCCLIGKFLKRAEKKNQKVESKSCLLLPNGRLCYSNPSLWFW